MRAPKCANCGNEMLETYTKTALKIYICPHTKLITTKTIDNRIWFGSIHCSIEIDGLRASFERLAKNSNLTLGALRRATNETIPDGELLENANLALMLGLPADELAALFKAAMKLGFATGIPTTKAIEALCKGVGRRSRLILDNIGIAFKAKDAYDAFPDLDKTEAWQKYAITMINEKARSLK